MSDPVEVGDVLLQCLREAGSPVPSPVLRASIDELEPTRLVAAAAHHGVLPAIRHAVMSWPDPSPSLLETLERQHREQWQTQLRALGDLTELVPLLDGLGVPWVVVKGPVLADAIYALPMARSYVDLDVLVPRPSLPAIVRSLEEGGASVADRAWMAPRVGARGEVTLTLRHGTALDLHWHLINDPTVRQAFLLSMDDLLSRARTVDVGGLRTPTLDAADTLIYVAVHAVLSGGARLVWSVDLHEIVCHDAPDWDTVVSRARAGGVSLVVAVMLERAHTTLGTAVPPEVLRALAPAWGWRAAIRLADRISPPARSFRRQLTGRTLTAATRRSAPASAVALARSLWSDVAWPLLTEPRHPWRRRLRPGRSLPVATLGEAPGEGVDPAVVRRRLEELAWAPGSLVHDRGAPKPPSGAQPPRPGP